MQAASSCEMLCGRLASKPDHFFGNPHRVIVIVIEYMFRVTLTGASVQRRGIVKAALAHNAADVILVHNHP